MRCTFFVMELVSGVQFIISQQADIANTVLFFGAVIRNLFVDMVGYKCQYLPVFAQVNATPYFRRVIVIIAKLCGVAGYIGMVLCIGIPNTHKGAFKIG